MSPNNQRTRVLALGPLPPWHTLITIDTVTTNHGRHSSLPHDHLFEVAAEWVGPPAIGFPPSLTPVSSRDVCVVTSLREAKEVAHRARKAFSQGGDRAPDLRDFLARSDPGAFPAHS
jgi:hypothetical protein